MDYKIIKFNTTFDRNFFGRAVEGQPIYSHSDYKKVWDMALKSIKKVPEMIVLYKKVDTTWVPTHRFCSMYQNGKIVVKPYKVH